MSESQVPQVPDWLKTLKSSDIDTAPASDLGDKVVPAPEAPAPEIPIIDYQPDVHDWLKAAPAPEPPAASELVLENSVPAAPSEAVASVAEEKPVEKVATIPLQPSEADQSAVAQQLKDRGRGMMDRRAARAAERTNLAERQKSMLKLQEAKEAVDRAKKVLPEPLKPEEALKLAKTENNLQRYADKMSPTTDAAVEERASRRRGGMTESAKAEKGLDVEDLQAEVACKQMVIADLGISGQEEAVKGLSSQYDAVNQESKVIAQRASSAFDGVQKAEAALRFKEAELKRKKLSPEDKDAILEKKRVDSLAARKVMADAVVEEKEVGLRQAEIKAKLDAANANLTANKITEAQIKGLISQRQDAINLATTEIAVAGQVSGKTRTELASARENCEQLARGSRREIAINDISGNINEVGAFVNRLAEVRVLPGGLQNQLGMIDTEINYLQQPGAVEGGLDPALEMAIERNVRNLGGGDAGREAYLRTLVRDRSTVQSLIDIDNDPYSLIQNPSTPAILRQALSETQAEEARRSANKVSGTEGQGAHGGFLEVNSEDQGVQKLVEVQRAAVTKVLESFGLTPPLTAAEQQHWQSVGGDLRGMEISGAASDSWRDIVSRAEIRQMASAELALAKVTLEVAQAEAKARAAELQVEIEEQKLKVDVAEDQVKSTSEVLDQTRRQVEDLAPLAEETKLAREAEAAKAEVLENARIEMEQALEQRAKFPGDTTHQAQVSTLDKSLVAAAENMATAGAGDEAQNALLKVINEQVGADLDAKGEKSATETAKILFDAIKSNEDVKTVAAKLRKVGMGLMGKALEAGVNPAQERALLAGFLDVVNNYLSADKTKLSEKETRHSLGRVAEAANVLSEAGFSGFGLIDPVVKLMIESMFSSK